MNETCNALYSARCATVCCSVFCKQTVSNITELIFEATAIYGKRATRSERSDLTRERERDGVEAKYFFVLAFFIHNSLKCVRSSSLFSFAFFSLFFIVVILTVFVSSFRMCVWFGLYILCSCRFRKILNGAPASALTASSCDEGVLLNVLTAQHFSK